MSSLQSSVNKKIQKQSNNIPIGNNGVNEIFQVSINSNKLICILNRFQENFKKIQTKITQVQSQFKQIHYSLNSKIIMADNSVRSYIKDQLKGMKSELQSKLNDTQTTHDQISKNKDLKIQSLNDELQYINKKIKEVKNYFQEELEKQVKNYSTDIWGLKRNIQKSEQQYQQNINSIQQKVQQYKQSVENYADYIADLQNHLKNNLDLISKGKNTFNKPQKKFQESINPDKYKNFIKDSQQTPENGKKHKTVRINQQQGKKNRAPSQQNYLSTIQYASIAVKVENLQKKLNESGNNNGQYEMYPHTQQQTRTNRSIRKKSLGYDKYVSMRSQQSLNICQYQDSTQIVQRIMFKLENITNLMQQKQKGMQKKIFSIEQKFILNEEKIDFIKQKITKINAEIGDIKLRMLAMDRKSQQLFQMSSIPLIHDQLGKIIQRMDTQFAKKIDTTLYKDNQQQIYQKLNEFNNFIKFKAEKQDVKKAISFIQDKIKQIILVIANQFNDQTIGSINKIQSKCLTCDKQIILKNDNFLTNRANSSRGAEKLRPAKDQLQKYNMRMLKSKKENNSCRKTLRYLTNLTQYDSENRNINQ